MGPTFQMLLVKVNFVGLLYRSGQYSLNTTGVSVLGEKDRIVHWTRHDVLMPVSHDQHTRPMRAALTLGKVRILDRHTCTPERGFKLEFHGTDTDTDTDSLACRSHGIPALPRRFRHTLVFKLTSKRHIRPVSLYAGISNRKGIPQR